MSKLFLEMASVGLAPTSGLRESSGHNAGVDRLPEEMNDMRIRDDKVCILKSIDFLFFVFFFIRSFIFVAIVFSFSNFIHQI